MARGAFASQFPKYGILFFREIYILVVRREYLGYLCFFLR